MTAPIATFAVTAAVHPSGCASCQEHATGAAIMARATGSVGGTDETRQVDSRRPDHGATVARTGRHSRSLDNALWTVTL